MDLFSRFSIAVPLKRTTSVDVARALCQNFITTFGAPRAILSDQGTNFMSEVFQSFAELFQIRHYRTSAYHPQSNGALERSHHSLIEYIKHYRNNNRDWEELISFATLSHNTSIHEGTGFTPYELVFGYPATLPSEFPPPEKVVTFDDYIVALNNHMKNVQEMAFRKQQKIKERTKRYYDRRTKTPKYQVGQLVFLIKEPKKGKLDSNYTGPFEILEIRDNHNVKLLMENGKTRIVHVDKVKSAYVADATPLPEAATTP